MNRRRKWRRERAIADAVGAERKFWREVFNGAIPIDQVVKSEIGVDNFCGGGGASLGTEFARGIPIEEAINHDEAAIAMHSANHPHTRHYKTSVWDVDPRTITAGRRVGFGWFSPDCTDHSNAKGGKPVKKRYAALLGSW